MGKKSSKMGRPLKSATGKPMDAQFNLRLTKAELRMLRSEAKREDCSVSDLLMRPWRKEDQ